MPMCLCLLTGPGANGDRQVLLGRKKTGLGTGKIVGLGGHVEPGETAAQAAVREVGEEAGLLVDPAALHAVAQVTYLFPARPRWDQVVSVFSASDWTGEPTETDEISPRWFPVRALPLGQMWDDARFWLPLALAGQRLTGRFTFASDCDTVAHAQLGPAPLA
ncbi:MAG TPA: 8-oxo-dGTP diphosphatase [Streptosporangiaceae bacterium]|jgi:8-oxo-dGTP diphosphatase